MKVLVATTKRQGEVDDDFCWTIDEDEADWLLTAVGDHAAGVIMRRRGDWWIAYAPVAA